MLRIIQNKAAAAAKSYYSQADYLSESQELAGRWGGRAATMLGLSGTVEKEAFDRLCDNEDPRSGKPLTLRTKSDRTVGYDFNFHVPKGVSLAYAFNQDDRIVDALRESVRETMEELETETLTRVRKHGLNAERKTGNLAWAEFVHTTARPVGGVPDPHLHAHCFVFNSTFDDKEHVWKAAQFREIKRAAPYFEAAFHARLAMRMRELGYEVKRERSGWDVAAIPKTLKDKFARRTQLIEAAAIEAGLQDAKDKDQLGARTREKKSKHHTMTELRQLWRERLTQSEIALMESLKDGNESTEPIARDRESERTSLGHAVKHCFERHSVTSKFGLLAEALRHGVGKVSVEGVHQELQNGGVILREIDGRVLTTTKEVLEEEQAMIAFARRALGSEPALNDDWKIRRDWFSPDQQAAVEHILSSKDRVIMVRGGAGTGKTSLMRETVEAIEASGKRVFTFAPSADASRGVLKAEGFAEATTVAELLVNKEMQQEAAGQVLWIDEAGLLGSPTLKRVFDVAQQHDCRVILSGDWKQHGAVERGAAMRLLEEQGKLRPALVREIQRQSGEYRKAVELFAEGNASAGLEKLDQLGWVHEIGERELRLEALATEYVDALKRKETVLAISPTHAEADLQTDVIRAALKRERMLGKEEQIVERLRPVRLTEAERGDALRLEESDIAVFHQNAKGIKIGERRAAQSLPVERLPELANRFEVFRREELRIARGELIRIIKNGKTKDKKHDLNNGTIFKVKAFTRTGDIVFSNGWIVSKDFGFLAPGYVTTSHSSQGKTVDHVLIAESRMSLPAASREQAYVSVSRGRKSSKIFTDDLDSLREAVAKDSSKVSALELVDDSARRRRLVLAQQGRQRDARVEERELMHG